MNPSSLPPPVRRAATLSLLALSFVASPGPGQVPEGAGAAQPAPAAADSSRMVLRVYTDYV